ncbi:apolipo protein O-domain-containing protein [Xylariomycetidae sp. FL2044]|nr:apolipo protein O-domain-containing protein [Xylariomycetidae sp. FL2044]
MAARVLLQRRVAAPFMAATLVGGALFPSVAHAEAPPREQPRKPIYDDFETQLPKSYIPVPSSTSDTIPASSSPPPPAPSSSSLESKLTTTTSNSHGPTPTDRLAVQVGKARMFLHRYATATEDAVNSAVDSAFDLEQSFTSTVASLAPSRESGERLMPGLVYVLVASMAGSIVTRNRNVLLRAAVPLALGLGAGWVLVPVTMGNVSDLLWRYEQRFPAVADAHLRTRDGLRQGWSFARVHADAGKQKVEETVHDARDLVEGWVKKGK